MSDLDLTLPLRTRGRPALPVECEIVRELTPEDLGKLGQSRGVVPTSLKKLRDSHHTIARLISTGLTDSEVCAITGYSASRISILKGDPAFAELIALYRSEVAVLEYDAMASSIAKASLLRELSLDRMIEAIEDDTATIDDAKDFFKLTADRTGMGPATKSTNLNVNVDMADRVAAGRKRVAQLGAATGQPLPGAAPSSAVQAEPSSKAEGE